MKINLIPDSSIGSAPAGLTDAVDAAATVFETDFPGNYTVNISYGWGTFADQSSAVLTDPSSGVFSIGGVESANFVTYSQLKGWLIANASSSAQISAVASLPASSSALPGAANVFLVSNAEEKALGVFGGNSGDLDGSIGFNVGDANQSSYWLPAALTEITHALGWLTIANGYPFAADLFRYSSPGHYQWGVGQAAYFSVDGGNTDLADFSTTFDETLFPNLPLNDPLRYPFTSSATTLTNLDIEALNAIGFSATNNPPSLPSNINFIDLYNFEASFPDLIAAFGLNQQAMQNWFTTYEPIERRVETFDGLDYVASYPDLINAYAGGATLQIVQDDGAKHFIANGLNEGRTTTFDGLEYVASYGDLISAFANAGSPQAVRDAGASHFITGGHNEGRTTTFDGLDYIASYSDLINAFGANGDDGAYHYIEQGHAEGRTASFDGLAYIANYADLMDALGTNNDAGATHYIENGHNEGRLTTFNVGAYESAHPDLLGKYDSNDAFLTAYIDTFRSTGSFLT